MSVLTELPTELYPADVATDLSQASPSGPATARAMMWLSQLAYEVPTSAKVGEIVRLWGLRLVAALGADAGALAHALDLNALVLVNETAIFVVFRGTDPLHVANWITNFDATLSANGAHQGFENAVDAMWNDLDAAIGQASRTGAGRQLVFGGHSLGGALAVLAAMKAVGAGRDVSAVYTFGMPRAGNTAFAESYNRTLGDRTYRFVYEVDVVPTVPPTAPIDYRHIGRYLPSRAGRFEMSSLTASPATLSAERWSDEPTFQSNLRAQIADFVKNPPRLEPSVFGRIAAAWRGFFGAPVATGRSDLVGLLIEQLPPPLRDHVPDRYCKALAMTA